MKKIFTLITILSLSVISLTACAQQDKSKRPSPPAIEKETTQNGVTISIDYSQPSLNNRMIGTELAKYGEVWRTGANEATIFEIDKDVKINNQNLAAGKYALFTIPNEKEWVIIFNKTWKQWGSFSYKEKDDVLRVTTTPMQSDTSKEKMTFEIDKNGKVSLQWGTLIVPFTVQ
jgi:hypothetical protein